ncbi:outer membrane protein assembly factor BamD [Enterobacteriaceae endosymbiont of Plateumaris consimilis]|uniref:outer membrane protein assembly factor BamD n=1 Tax=Enterobacteriaceae endosymbiont of Plateumaris consimilis TaxID=2675794 RepID=UPI001448EBFC|nr:outer membrane protein assembly factor BamD [Enterobacteriaceae endosymbiont of Plateumaris consimilis]QJC28782.1 outer membrane protein assembly factor BamD [Enterobacteriaceae endosymbiont of Plateumaris consimilis]
MKKIIIKNIFCKILIVSLLVIITNCSQYKHINNKKKIVTTNFFIKTKYLEANNNLFKKNYTEAMLQFEQLDKLYPYSKYTEQIKVNLIYLYYLNKRFISAIDLFDEFIRIYPISKYTDYLLYIKSLSEISLDNNKMQYLFRINRNDCNPFYANQAIYDLQLLVKNYPNSIYIPFIKKRLKFLKKRLALYELNVIQFYFNKEMYISVVKRCEMLIKNYPYTSESILALIIMEKTYKILNVI